jgi:hypothetical protein
MNIGIKQEKQSSANYGTEIVYIFRQEEGKPKSADYFAGMIYWYEKFLTAHDAVFVTTGAC